MEERKMRVNIDVDFEDFSIEGGWLEWNLPTLPRVGEAMSDRLITRSFDPKRVYECLSDERKLEWDKNREDLRPRYPFDEELEKACFLRYFPDCDWLVVKQIWWQYSDEFGPYPHLIIENRSEL